MSKAGGFVLFDGPRARRLLHWFHMDYEGRQKKLLAVLPLARLDSLLLTHLPNIRYICGFTGSAAALLVMEGGCIFFSDGRYATQARAEVHGAKIVIVRKSPLTAAAEWINDHRRRVGRRMGIEAESLTVDARDRLKAEISSGPQLRATVQLVERLRMVKDAEEIERIRKAVNVGASLFDQALRTINAGTTEAEVAAKMEYAARKAGAESMSFPTIIASGQRSALPHGRATNAAIAAGFVVCDFGVILAGYCSDETRTVHVGRLSDGARRAYGAVRAAQQVALETVRPGRMASEVDWAARKSLAREKFGRYFTHSTGHGVGLEIHEAPRVAAGQTEVLCPGMVITIEPGVYLPGKWGIRIEDMVVVTEKGCEVLTPTSKELVTL